MVRSEEFLQLLTVSQSRIYAYILSLVFDPNQADDILQQTNAVMWKQESDFQLGTNFIAWAFRIAYFQVLDHRRKQQRERLMFDDDILQEMSESVSQADEQFETRHRLLRHCLERLPKRQRVLIRLRYSLGEQLGSIAQKIDMNVNAVKQDLFRARNSLVRCVETRMIEEQF